MAEETGKSPIELLNDAVQATPLNLELARQAFAGFNAQLPTLDDASKAVAIDAIAKPIEMGVSRLEYAGDTNARDEFLGQATLHGMIKDGLSRPAQESPQPRRRRTKTRGRDMSAAKS